MIAGIDLGTTNSLIRLWRNGEPVLISNSLGESLTPSAVRIDEDGKILVGAAARERLSSHPARSAASFKRLMGTNRESSSAQRFFAPRSFPLSSCAR